MNRNERDREMRNRQKMAADWATRGFSCDLWTDPPGQRWEDFAHATNELATLLEGDMKFEVPGQVHHPRPGEKLLIPTGAVHSAQNIGSTTARWLYGYGGRQESARKLRAGSR